MDPNSFSTQYENQRNYIHGGVSFGSSCPQAFGKQCFSSPGTHVSIFVYRLQTQALTKRAINRKASNRILSVSSFGSSTLVLDNLLTHPLEAKGDVGRHFLANPDMQASQPPIVSGTLSSSLPWLAHDTLHQQRRGCWLLAVAPWVCERRSISPKLRLVVWLSPLNRQACQDVPAA